MGLDISSDLGRSFVSSISILKELGFWLPTTFHHSFPYHIRFIKSVASVVFGMSRYKLWY